MCMKREKQGGERIGGTREGRRGREREMDGCQQDFCAEVNFQRRILGYLILLEFRIYTQI